MFRPTRITTFTTRGTEQAGAAWRMVNAQPGWVTRATALAFFIVLAVPILLLILLALLIATGVFGVLWAAGRIGATVRGILSRNDGRENVRVIQRQPPDS